MANEELKAAAWDGQPKALEALMNQSFGKQGITARVIRSGELLKVTLRSKSLPDQQVADLVKKGIANIKPQGISKVSLKGEQIGRRESWTTEWNIAGDSPKATTVVSSKKTQKWYFHPGVIIGGAVGALALLGGLGSLVGGPKQPDAEAEVVEVVEAPSEPTDYLALGKQQGYEAAVATQDAADNQWYEVTQKWDLAMRSLSQVPTDSPDYATAQAKIAEYTTSYNVAKERHRVYQAGLERAQAEIKPRPANNFEAELRKADPNGLLVRGTRPSEVCDTCAEIVVTTNYLSLNKATRLELANNLWKAWAAQVSASDPDKAYIYLVTQSGTKVGGSSMWGGSDVSVDD